MEHPDTSELIHRRRRQILVHSILYYRLGESIIPDAVFDKWAKDLVTLQTTHPEISSSVPYMLEEFSDFAGETGFHLPLMDERASAVAYDLLDLTMNKEKVN